ncbi:uncharacterized protein O3C94_008672 [Discoglossus pictus]
MSVKVHYLHSHLDRFPENLGDVSEEQEVLQKELLVRQLTGKFGNHKVVYGICSDSQKLEQIEENSAIFGIKYTKKQEKQKICLLKEIIEFYRVVYTNVSTSNIPAQRIYSYSDNLLYLHQHCLKCHSGKKNKHIKENRKEKHSGKKNKHIKENRKEKECCKEIIQNKEELKEEYLKTLKLNRTAIIQHQLKLLKTAKRKMKRQPTEIQEKATGELTILQDFFLSLEERVTVCF